MKKQIETRKTSVIGRTFSAYLKDSITSFCFLLITLTGCFCAIWGLLDDKDLSSLGLFVFGIFTSGFGGKYLNKKFKRKGEQQQ